MADKWPGRRLPSDSLDEFWSTSLELWRHLHAKLKTSEALKGHSLGTRPRAGATEVAFILDPFPNLHGIAAPITDRCDLSDAERGATRHGTARQHVQDYRRFVASSA